VVQSQGFNEQGCFHSTASLFEVLQGFGVAGAQFIERSEYRGQRLHQLGRQNAPRAALPL